MTPFIGTKSVLATPMTKAAYNDYRGWGMPEGEAPELEGYLIEYTDGGEPNHPEHKGYISWTPAEQFDNAYQASGEMSFGHATLLAKAGMMVSRLGWNGAYMFAFIVPEGRYEPRAETPKEAIGDDGLVHYRAYWALRTAQGDITTWAPSGSDSLANDWGIVE